LALLVVSTAVGTATPFSSACSCPQLNGFPRQPAKPASLFETVPVQDKQAQAISGTRLGTTGSAGGKVMTSVLIRKQCCAACGTLALALASVRVPELNQRIAVDIARHCIHRVARPRPCTPHDF
jgi:hypothetical protein